MYGVLEIKNVKKGICVSYQDPKTHHRNRPDYEVYIITARGKGGYKAIREDGEETLLIPLTDIQAGKVYRTNKLVLPEKKIQSLQRKNRKLQKPEVNNKRAA